MKYKLSPSTLNLMEECNRCFWLHVVRNVKRPFGMMAGIVMKMDSIIKHYFDSYREKDLLPPMVEGKITGFLPKNMPKTLSHEENSIIIIAGKPDEYLELPTGEIVAFDHKTKSKAPEEAHPSNQLQLDVYTYLLKMNGYKTANKGYLAFYYPEDCELHDGMDMHVKILEIKTDPDRVKTLLSKADNILQLEEPPQPSKECEYCLWAKGVSQE